MLYKRVKWLRQEVEMQLEKQDNMKKEKIVLEKKLQEKDRELEMSQ